MRHGYMYNGAFELNYTSLRVGTDSYQSTEGETRRLPAWPDKIDGIRVGYMEKSGKKFYAVRVQYDDHDVVLENPVRSEEHTSELQSHVNLVCRLLLEKKKKNTHRSFTSFHRCAS